MQYLSLLAAEIALPGLFLPLTGLTIGDVVRTTRFGDNNGDRAMSESLLLRLMSSFDDSLFSVAIMSVCLFRVVTDTL